MPVTRVQPVNATDPLEIETDPGATVAGLKLGIEARTGIRVSAQRLVAGGRLLQDDALLESLDGRIFLAKTVVEPEAEEAEAVRSSQEDPGSPCDGPDGTEIRVLLRAVWSDGRQEEATILAKGHLPVREFKSKAWEGGA